MLDRALRRLLRGTVRSLVREELTGPFPAGEPHEDPLLFHAIVYGPRDRLHVHPTAVVNDALFNVWCGHITVGPHAFFGHSVSLLTGAHDYTKFGRARQVEGGGGVQDDSHIVIGEGAWLSSKVTVCGPCRIGEHAVVGVGSVVLHRDVPPYTVVAGVPARVIREIPRPLEAERG